MRPAISIAELREALAEAGLEEPLRVDGRTGLPAVLGGFVHLDGRRLELRVTVDADFPLSLPIIAVVDHEALGFVPHLTQSGFICYHEGEGTVQSLWHPERTAAAALRLACKTLRESLAGLRDADLVEEMEWSWSRQQKHGTWWFSSFEPGEQTKLIRRYGTMVVDKRSWPVRAFWPQVAKASALGLYIPLSPTSTRRLQPSDLLEPAGLRRILWGKAGFVTRDNRRRAKARLRRRRGLSFLVLAVPRPSGDRALIAIDLSRTPYLNSTCETLMKGDDIRMEPVLVHRFDRQRTQMRGGADPSLASKRVAIVGIGAVGGYVADAMARTGIGSLSLIDPDSLLPENAYRHVLGLELGFLGLPQNKAELMAQRLRRSLPHLRVEPVAMTIEAAVADNSVNLARFDLVIVAIGTPPRSRWINETILKIRGPRALYTWLEPLGIGGHALLTAAGAPGCYECLFVDNHGRELLAPRTDFFEPDQDLLSRFGGCGAAYSPFSDLDARRTAELATRLAVAALRGEAPEPALRSWRGNDAAARERGLRLRARYTVVQGRGDALSGTVVARRCPLCAPMQP